MDIKRLERYLSKFERCAVVAAFISLALLGIFIFVPFKGAGADFISLAQGHSIFLVLNSLFLLILCFFIRAYIESKTLRRMTKAHPSDLSREASIPHAAPISMRTLTPPRQSTNQTHRTCRIAETRVTQQCDRRSCVNKEGISDIKQLELGNLESHGITESGFFYDGKYLRFRMGLKHIFKPNAYAYFLYPMQVAVALYALMALFARAYMGLIPAIGLFVSYAYVAFIYCLNPSEKFNLQDRYLLYGSKPVKMVSFDQILSLVILIDADGKNELKARRINALGKRLIVRTSEELITVVYLRIWDTAFMADYAKIVQRVLGRDLPIEFLHQSVPEQVGKLNK